MNRKSQLFLNFKFSFILNSTVRVDKSPADMSESTKHVMLMNAGKLKRKEITFLFRRKKFEERDRDSRVFFLKNG